MIRTMLNLKCEVGHYHFSPTPERFAGAVCFRAVSADGRSKRCMAPLAKTKPPVQVVHGV